jgi:hypothetical protein
MTHLRCWPRFTGYPEKTRTVVASDGTKFTRLSTREELLFDLVEDPDEIAPLVDERKRRAVGLELLGDLMLDAADSARGQAVTTPA